MRHSWLAMICLVGTFVATQAAWAQRSAEVVNEAYQEAFGRDATEGERTYWLNQRNDWPNKQALVNLHAQFIKSNAGAKVEVVNRSYWTAFGKAATDGERNYWSTQRNDWSTHLSLVQLHAQFIKGNPTVRQDVLNQSFQTAYGRPATEGERNHWLSRGDWSTAADMMRHHWNYFVGNEPAAREIIGRSYNNVLGRDMTAGEFEFWRHYVTHNGWTYAQFAERHKAWRAQEVQRVQHDPQTLAELKSRNLAIRPNGDLVRVDPSSAGQVLSHNGGAVIAVSGQWGTAAGMVAAGAGNVLPSGAGGLVGNSGNTLIGNDGGSFKANALVMINSAGRMVAAGAGN